MFELYLRCPASDRPIYAGIHSSVNDRVASRVFLKSSMCPACGGTHDWRTAEWSAVPVTLPLQEAPPVYAPAAPEELPKVA